MIAEVRLIGRDEFNDSAVVTVTGLYAKWRIGPPMNDWKLRI